MVFLYIPKPGLKRKHIEVNSQKETYRLVITAVSAMSIGRTRITYTLSNRNWLIVLRVTLYHTNVHTT